MRRPSSNYIKSGFVMVDEASIICLVVNASDEVVAVTAPNLAAFSDANFGNQRDTSNVMFLVWFSSLKDLNGSAAPMMGTSTPPHELVV
jgi:hypothetical protein